MVKNHRDITGRYVDEGGAAKAHIRKTADRQAAEAGKTSVLPPPPDKAPTMDSRTLDGPPSDKAHTTSGDVEAGPTENKGSIDKDCGDGDEHGDADLHSQFDETEYHMDERKVPSPAEKVANTSASGVTPSDQERQTTNKVVEISSEISSRPNADDCTRILNELLFKEEVNSHSKARAAPEKFVLDMFGGLNIVTIPGDGDCGFSSVIRAATGAHPGPCMSQPHTRHAHRVRRDP